MPFIRVQNLKKDEQGRIVRGSAGLIDAVYVKGQKQHSRQSRREVLGRVVWLAENKRSGIFLSPTRGLTEYDADKDEFSDADPEDNRVKSYAGKHELLRIPETHAVFGDVWWRIEGLKASGLLPLLKKTAQGSLQGYERLLCHTLWGTLRDGSHISCGDFTARSVTGTLFKDIAIGSLDGDTAHYSFMGSDLAKESFFKGFVALMKKSVPGFGDVSYVDSTPLPNDIENNPYNALCCHGTGSCAVQTRLAVVQDYVTGLPVWYSVIPGNVLDLSTLSDIADDVYDTLGVVVNSAVLDAGYVCSDVVKAFCGYEGKHLIARMPAKRGFPFRELWSKNKDELSRGRHAFVRDGHYYHAITRNIKLFDCGLHAYVYIDDTNAGKLFSEWQSTDEGAAAFAAEKPSEQDWETVRRGYFVLLSSDSCKPDDMLDRYFERMSIESMFKDLKRMGLLPLRKWSPLTVKGKILQDMIGLIAILMQRKTCENKEVSESAVIGKLQSLICRTGGENISIDHPNKQVKEIFKNYGYKLPQTLSVSSVRKSLQIA